MKRISLVCFVNLGAAPAMFSILPCKKYFSDPSLVIHFFLTPPRKLKLGLQIRGRLLIATHLDEALGLVKSGEQQSEANCAKMQGENDFAEPNQHALPFLHSMILISRITYWAPLEMLWQLKTLKKFCWFPACNLRWWRILLIFCIWSSNLWLMHCGAGVCADIVQMLGHHIFYCDTVHRHSALVWKQPDVCRASGSGVGLGYCHILYLVCGLCHGRDLFLVSCKFLAQFSGLIQLLYCYHCHPLDNCILSASSSIRHCCVEYFVSFILFKFM